MDQIAKFEISKVYSGGIQLYEKGGVKLPKNCAGGGKHRAKLARKEGIHPPQFFLRN